MFIYLSVILLDPSPMLPKGEKKQKQNKGETEIRITQGYQDGMQTQIQHPHEHSKGMLGKELKIARKPNDPPLLPAKSTPAWTGASHCQQNRNIGCFRIPWKDKCVCHGDSNQLLQSRPGTHLQVLGMKCVGIH